MPFANVSRYFHRYSILRLGNEFVYSTAFMIEKPVAVRTSRGSTSKPKHQLQPLFPGIENNHTSLYEFLLPPISCATEHCEASESRKLSNTVFCFNLEFFVSGNSVCGSLNLKRTTLRPLVEIPFKQWHNLKVVLSPNGTSLLRQI